MLSSEQTCSISELAQASDAARQDATRCEKDIMSKEQVTERTPGGWERLRITVR